MATKNKKSGGGNRGVLMTVAVGAMAIIMVLTMMLPSLSLIFANNKGTTESTEESGSSTPTTVAEADEKYQPTVDTLQEQLDADPNSLSALANLGYTYFDWATTVRNIIQTIDSGATVTASESQPESAETPASPSEAAEAETPASSVEPASADEPASAESAQTPETPEEATPTVTVDDRVHQEDLFRRAEGYFDRYLALSDSESITVSRILCEYYLGNESEATTQLADFCKEHEFGPAWANLGMMYASAGEMDKAREAFESAEAADPNDEYGSKSYAEQYIAYLDQIEQLTASLSGSGSEVTTTVGSDGTSVITLDGSGASSDGSVVVSTNGQSTSGSTGSTGTSAPTNLKDSVGGLF